VATYGDVLKLVVARDRRPVAKQPARLHDLFRTLQAATEPDEAAAAEDAIWAAWMRPAPGRDTDELERATRAIVASDYACAERILADLNWRAPDFAEAWHKRATLLYVQSRDAESIAAIRRTLELEPRHFGAMCAFGQILLDREDRDGAAFAFDAALRLNPHLGGEVRATAAALLSSPQPRPQ
jgi:tetratricopeptide (TPR) repeat protein